MKITLNKITLLLCLSLLFVECNQNPEAKQKKEVVFEELSSQYLLTNEISIENREIVYGGSSYLINYHGEVYLCTAKHLTTGAMGFEPSLNLKKYKNEAEYWTAYPRNDKLANDTISTDQLFFSNNEFEDIIALSLVEVPENIGVLTPQFSKLEKGARLRILGCEYSDYECNQKSHFGTFDSYINDREMMVNMDESDISLSGFSGAPVLDEHNKVVGHLVAGSGGDGEALTVYLTPIQLIKKFLK